MRRFSLINANGDTYNLTDDVNNVLLGDVTGLGIERDDEYRIVGSRYIRVSKTMGLGKVEGTIYFYGDKPYDQFQKYMNFAVQEPLYLQYTPMEGGFTYTAVVNMPKIQKGELDHDLGHLACKVEFAKTSLFYREVKVITEGRKTNDNYAFAFSGGNNHDSVIWDSKTTNKFRSAANMNVIIDSDSYESSPCKLIIDGPVVNPSWSHYVDGDLETTGKVNCSVPEGYRLVIDSISDYTSILILDKDLKIVYQDVYQLSDFSTDRFIYLQHGKNSIQVSTESADIVTVQLDGRLSYAAV